MTNSKGRSSSIFSSFKSKKVLVALAISLVLVLSSFFFFKVRPNYQSNSQDVQEITLQEVEHQKEVLLSEAIKENVQVSDAQVDDLISNGLASYGISEGEFDQKIAEAGLTKDQYKEELRKQITISELIKKNVDLSGVEVSDNEVDNYLNLHKTEFADFFDEEEDLQALKDRIKLVLLRNKQTKLVEDYINSLG